MVLQSVVNYDVTPPESVCHWAVQLEDAESANLLEQLPAAVTWLERALRQKGSKVLVHCNAGGGSWPQIDCLYLPAVLCRPTAA